MKKLLSLLILVSSLFAQDRVAPLPNSKPQFFTKTGTLCSGCKLYSFVTGTVTPLPTYTDSSGAVQNTNPITMGSDGRPPQEIWLGAFAYDITLKDSFGAAIYTVKNISVPNIQALTQVSLTVTGPVIIASSTPGIASSSSVLEWDALYSNGTSILTDKFQCSDIPVSFISANPATVLTCNHTGSSGGGSVLFNFPFLSISVTGLSTLSGGVCYSFENGQSVVKVSVSCGYTTWALALAACPSTGCILDGWAPDVPLALGAFDTASNTKPVTVRLGPYNFTATQITVRQGLDFAGAGIVNTNVTSNGTNAQPLFVNPQVNNNAITVKIHDFSANALSGNTSQDGFFFDCSTLTNAGVELSRFDNIIFNGFKGAVVHFKATQDGASGSIGCTQGNTLANITAIRPTGATGASQNALRIEGGAGQFDFWNCWFDGQSSDTGTNVFVGTTGTQSPYSIRFHDTTNQNGFAYLFDGCIGCTTEKDHLEVIKGVYNFANTASPVVGFHSANPYINSNVAVNAGNGYIVNIPAGAPQTDVIVESPLIGGQPDKCVINAANGANVQILNAQYQPNNTPTNVCVTSGMTFTAAPAATLDIRRAHTVQLSASGTSITTLRSDLQPGEIVTFYPTGNAQFATGGNLSLANFGSPLVLTSGDSITFIRVDAGTPAFIVQSVVKLGRPTFQSFTASGTHTIAAGVTAEKVTLCGAGGAGGGATAANNGGGGGAGAAAVKYLTGLTPGNTITVTVGAKGTGVSAAAGNSGTASSIASGTQTITTVTAPGGIGGNANGAQSAGGAGGGISTNGDLNFGGNPGAGDWSTISGAAGGGSIWGGAGTDSAGGNPGVASTANSCSGGGGAGAGANRTGGNGADGLVVFEWTN
jgi:hypothetical protein